MKVIQVKYFENRAFLSVAVPTAEGDIIKKTVIANDGASIWKALQFLSSIESLPTFKQDAIHDAIAKQKDREVLEVAVENWIAAGNQIKVCPAFGHKVKLSEDQMAAVMNMVGELDIGAMLSA